MVTPKKDISFVTGSKNQQTYNFSVRIQNHKLTKALSKALKCFWHLDPEKYVLEVQNIGYQKITVKVYFTIVYWGKA